MSSLIVPEFVLLGSSPRVESELFESMVAPLIVAGRVDGAYLEALVEREATYPTGLPVPGGVAIPHAAPEHVLEDAIAIAILDSPVKFREMGAPDQNFVDVHVVFMLALRGEHHLSLLQKVVKNVVDPGFVAALRGAPSAEAVVRMATSRFVTGSQAQDGPASMPALSPREGAAR